jgi:hypothetical protein
MVHADAGIEARLVGEGLLRAEGDALRSTPRWQAAVMRAAQRLLRQGEKGEDVRVPIAAALLELFPHASDAELAAMTLRMAEIEAREAGAVPQAQR